VATAKLYGKLYLSLFNKEIDFDSDTIKVALCTSSYTPNQDTHQYFSSITNEVVGVGYTAGGATLASKTITYDAATKSVYIDALDTSWPASTITARYAIIYDAQTGVAATMPLIGYLDFTVDQISDAGTFLITWDILGTGKFGVA